MHPTKTVGIRVLGLEAQALPCRAGHPVSLSLLPTCETGMAPALRGAWAPRNGSTDAAGFPEKGGLWPLADETSRSGGPQVRPRGSSPAPRSCPGYSLLPWFLFNQMIPMRAMVRTACLSTLSGRSRRCLSSGHLLAGASWAVPLTPSPSLASWRPRAPGCPGAAPLGRWLPAGGLRPAGAPGN